MGGVQHWIPLVHMDDRRELDAAEILVFRVAPLVQHVAVDWIGNPCRYEFNEFLVINCPVDFVLPESGKRDYGHLSSVPAQAFVRMSYERLCDSLAVARHRRL